MYAAFINGKALDLEEVSISLKLTNPMFDQNMGMEASASYPFKLPNTPHNMAILGFPGRLSKQMPYPNDFEFEHRFGAIKLPGTQLRIIKVTNTEIEAYIKIGRSEFISVSKDKTLQDLDFGLTEIVDYQTADLARNEVKKWLLSTTPGEYPACFPLVKNIGLFGASNFAQYWMPGIGAGPYHNGWTLTGTHWADPFNSKPDYGRRPVITPMPWLNTVIEQIFAEAQYSIASNDFFDNETLRKLCIFNPIIGRNQNDISHKTTFNLQYHLPEISITSFFTSLRVPFGIDLYFHHTKREVRLISRDSIVTSTEPPVQFSDKVSKSKTVFIEPPANNFHFSMKADANDSYWQETMLVNKDQLLADPASVMYANMLPSDQDVNAICLVIDENWWYMNKEDENMPGEYIWTRFSYNWQDAILGTGDVKFEAPITPLPTIWEVPNMPNIDMGTIAVPVVTQQGNMQRNPIYSGQEYCPFSLRLLFYHGLVKQASSDYFYAYASSLFPELNATPASQPFDMSWRAPEEITAFKDNGLFNNFWHNWVEWRKRTTQVELIKHIDALDLFNLDFSKKYLLSESQFILEQLDVTITRNSILPAKIKAWTF